MKKKLKHEAIKGPLMNIVKQKKIIRNKNYEN